MRLIDADAVLKGLDDLKKSPWYHFDNPFVRQGMRECMEVVEEACIKDAPTVEAIVCDDNFGFAGYIIENDEYGTRVEEAWNKDLTDEELLAVMCGVIQDILADERLKRLWENATEMAEFLGGYDG